MLHVKTATVLSMGTVTVSLLSTSMVVTYHLWTYHLVVFSAIQQVGIETASW